MLFWKNCWNLVGIRGWVTSTGCTWATSSTQGQCFSVFVHRLQLVGQPVSNISELSWILFFNVGRYILCREVSEIKGCGQTSNLPTFKISGMHYIILFKHGTKFSSFTHLMLPPHFADPSPKATNTEPYTSSPSKVLAENLPLFLLPSLPLPICALRELKFDTPDCSSSTSNVTKRSSCQLSGAEPKCSTKGAVMLHHMSAVYTFCIEQQHVPLATIFGKRFRLLHVE